MSWVQPLASPPNTRPTLKLKEYHMGDPLEMSIESINYKIDAAHEKDLAFLLSWMSLEAMPSIETSHVEIFTGFLQGTKLKHAPFLDTSSAVNMRSMFSLCSDLETVYPYDTSSVTNMDSMFAYCESLKTIPVLDTSKVTSMAGMFNGCTSLETIPELDVGAVTDFGSGNWSSPRIFEDCPNLSFVGFRNARTSLYLNDTNMDAPALNHLFSNLATISEYDYASITVRGTPGALTCDASIAESKGWWVIRT